MSDTALERLMVFTEPAAFDGEQAGDTIDTTLAEGEKERLTMSGDTRITKKMSADIGEG